MPTHIGTSASDPLRLAEVVRHAYDEGLSPEGGFLPPDIPLTSLPGPLGRYVDLCRELPRHYHAPEAHVRPWLDDRLRGGGPEEIEQAGALTEPQCHLLMTGLGLLAHAYRWDSAPPRPHERQRTSLGSPSRWPPCGGTCPAGWASRAWGACTISCCRTGGCSRGRTAAATPTASWRARTSSSRSTIC